MNNFEMLKQYIIPKGLLMEMLHVYQLLGRNEIYEAELGGYAEGLRIQTIEKDTYFLASMIGLTISDNRMRLIVTKGSLPKSVEEKNLVGIKEVLRSIQKQAGEFPFNGSDILQLMNKIYGKNATKFSTANFEPKTKPRGWKPISVRLTYERMLETYHQMFTANEFEHICLSMIAYMEMSQLRPYDSNNEIACLIALYYMLLRSGVTVFHYISFFEIYQTYQSKINFEREAGSINYPDGYLQLSGLTTTVFHMITEAYQTLQNILKEQYYGERAFKSDTIEQTIYRLPHTFTKEDIRKYHPTVSESTINRALFKLRDEQIIMPLGKGRSARWVKLIAENHPRNIFDHHYEPTEE